MNAKNLILFAAILMAVAMACGLTSGGSDQFDPGIETIVTNQEESAPDETAPIEEISAPLFIPVEAEIVLLTAESGNGPHPLFKWEAVPGADLYQLYVLEESGSAYWAWEGTVTEVFLGGFDSQPDSWVDGPILLEPMEWAVVAVTEDGEFLASSRLKPVAP